MVQPVGDQEHHLIPGIRLQLDKDRILGAAVQCREGVIQHQHRAGMGQRPGQCQTLCLPAGKAGAAAADDRLRTLFHGQHFLLQGSGCKPRHGILFAAAEDIILHGVGTQFRVMAKIPNRGGDLARGQGGKLSAAKADRALIGRFAEEYAAKGGFSAGDRAGDADDIAGVGRQAQAGKDRLFAIGEGEFFQRHILCRRDLQGIQLLGRFHQGSDALPGDFCLLHRVEELGHLGGFDHQLGETGKEGGEGGNIPAAPAGAQHILCAEPQDEEGPCLGCRQIKRRQSGLPHVVPHGSLFVKAQGLLVFFHPGLLAAVDAVGHGIPGTVQRGTAQDTGGLFIGRTGTLHRLFHPCRADIGHGSKKQAQDRQPPVVHQQHNRIARQRHTGVEHLRGELAHSLHAVVHIGDGLGHQLTGPLFFQRCPALPHQIGVQDALHPAVDVVGEAAHIKAFDEARRLHQQCDCNVVQHQQRHLGSSLTAAQDIRQALGQPALEPRRGQQTDVIDKARKGHKEQREPLHPEIGEDPVRAERFIFFHGAFYLLRVFHSVYHGTKSIWTALFRKKP